MKYTEGEKKVIENFKYWIQTNTERGVCTIPDYICINALNLLEKQQKEIEWLSFDNKILDCQLDSNGKNIDMLKNEILNNMISKEAIRKKNKRIARRIKKL